MMTDIDETEAINIQAQAEKQESENEETVDLSGASSKLAEGLLSIYQLPLELVKKELAELTTKQEALISHMQSENIRIYGTLEDLDVNQMLQTIQVYQGKLAAIKKEMSAIHERTVKLKKRAIRLQQLKQREAHNRGQDNRGQERERGTRWEQVFDDH